MKRRSTSEQSQPRFILVTPVIEDRAAFAEKLIAACAAADVAGVILKFGARVDAKEFLAQLRGHSAAQANATVFLLDGLLDLVTPTGADGVHLTNAGAIQSVQSVIDDKHIIGVGRLASRHDAMTAGEAGADYVMFGEPDVDGRRPGLPALIERVTWWAELFRLPSIAYAGDLEEIPLLAKAGADFIALGEETIWKAPEDIKAVLETAATRLPDKEPVS